MEHVDMSCRGSARPVGSVGGGWSLDSRGTNTNAGNNGETSISNPLYAELF